MSIDPNFTVEQGRQLDAALHDLAAARRRISELEAALRDIRKAAAAQAQGKIFALASAAIGKQDEEDDPDIRARFAKYLETLDINRL